MTIDDLDPNERLALELKRKKDFERGVPVDRTGAKDITLGEQCYLARYRSGINLKDLAELTGVSHVSLIKRERNRGEVEALAEFWTARDWGSNGV